VRDPKTGRSASVRFRFRRENTHAWTRGAEPSEDVHARDRGSPRTFDRARARHMDLLYPLPHAPVAGAEGPRRAGPLPRHQIDQANAYVVVVAVEMRGQGAFVTAQPRPMAASLAMARALDVARPGDLPPSTFQKAIPPSLLAEDGGYGPILGGFQGLCPPPEGAPLLPPPEGRNVRLSQPME
jgi:hypothetical protein